ncbi:ParB/RepB/Spo0J family partition protein [Streptomyces sp. NPDC018833]|uniref:ParB/RepB/Spo0J family partition protein n=1 Tax=Streptomyces sp. NPDC018833 TaxID=3365053 RepID=UPI0037B3AFD3
MSVADRLGTGSSFGGVPRGRSARGRAKAVTQGDVPAYELVRIHLDEVSPTPLNPRRNFGTDDEKTRFGEELRTAQLAACVVVTRGAYLQLWPEHDGLIGAARFVLVNGERRYRSAHHVGLETLDFVVRDDLAATKEDFVNHLLKENLEREDFDVIERARGVQQMVAVCSNDSGKGAQTRAAERLNKDRSWVTNQLDLLILPEEIQLMLSAGEIPERDGRLLARHIKKHPDLGAAELIEYLRSTKEREAQEREARRALLRAATQQAAAPASSALSADNGRGGSLVAPGGEVAPVLSADNVRGAAGSGSVGGPLVDGGAEPVLSADNGRGGSLVAPESEVPPVLSADNTGQSSLHMPQQRAIDIEALPWSDPAWFAEQLRKRMSADGRDRLVALLRDEDMG